MVKTPLWHYTLFLLKKPISYVHFSCEMFHSLLNFPKKEKEFCYWFGKGLIQCMFNIPPIGVKDQKNWTFLIFRHYIVSWLSAVGPVVGLKLPLEYGKLCVSWQPFSGGPILEPFHLQKQKCCLYMKCYKPNVYKNVKYEYLFLLKNSVWLPRYIKNVFIY